MDLLQPKLTLWDATNVVTHTTYKSFKVSGYNNCRIITK